MTNKVVDTAVADAAVVKFITDRTGLSTAKWEMEFARTGRKSLLSFGTADMDFQSPEPVVQAISAAAKRGHFGYPFKSESYYAAVTGYFQRQFDWKVERAWIQSATGIYASMGSLVLELSEPGDEIVYQTPVHQIFEEIIQANDRVPVPNPLRMIDGCYEMDFDHLQQVITERTKLLFLCSPHNPVGRIWSEKDLLRLHEICEKNGVIVIADEVYSGLLYPGQKFTPMASVSHAASLNTITLASASKSFNTTGLKHSLVIAENADLRDASARGMRRLNMQYGGSIFGQIATEVAFRDCDEWSRQLMGFIAENLAVTRQFFAQHIPQAKVTDPQATYFAWIDFSFMRLTNAELLSFFDEEANVVVSSGAYLGPGGEGHIRLNLGCSREMLLEGLQRIQQAYCARAQHPR